MAMYRWAYVVWDLNFVKLCAFKGHQVANVVRIPEPFSPASCAECSACCGRAKVQVLLHANADYVVVTWDLTVV